MVIHLLDDVESILPPPQTLTGSLGHTEIERITPEFHLGLDGTQNKYWDLKPGKTTAIEYNASGEELRKWEYEETSIKGIYEWKEKPLK
ncbi:MAG: hypothetical protein J6W13_11260 [Salinivirgaceae bacterium]|nr:hypothetical protein [Salinivirgaceae bacterium]